MSLRKKIANSPRINRMVEGFFASYIRFAFRTSRWTRSGLEDMDACVVNGEAVMCVLWHQRLIMAPFIFNGPADARMCTLTTAARAGRLGGNIMTRFGWETVPMSTNQRHVSLSRKVLRLTREGCSIGATADGPSGPPRVCSGTPVMWARTTRCRVFVVSFATRAVIRLPTWDKQMLPLPFTHGALIGKEWAEVVPRKLSDEQAEKFRQSLEEALDEVTDATDAAVGRGSEKTNKVSRL
ncbi:lysophospholipid acyltransferase family protein [Pseudopelagicola sp. nBUS_20]|mgnify:FL=1|uniref:lysophospholipid acyltransferase family protein n=1 Tax=Pseudopelagicola sp. nBUS_20 TaxID=3395317 RepID=UPI003EBED9DC